MRIELKHWSSDERHLKQHADAVAVLQGGVAVFFGNEIDQHSARQKHHLPIGVPQKHHKQLVR